MTLNSLMENDSEKNTFIALSCFLLIATDRKVNFSLGP